MVLEFWSEQTLRISVDGPDGSRSLTVNKPFALFEVAHFWGRR